MSDVKNPACENCDDDVGDPFSSFPTEDMSLSLTSHWNPNQCLRAQSPITSFKFYIVEQSEKHVPFLETFDVWKEVFQKNLEDILSKWDEMFMKMEKTLDEGTLNNATVN